MKTLAILLGEHPCIVNSLYWNGQLVWTPALALYLCVGDRGLCPAGFIAHLRLYRHIRQAGDTSFGNGIYRPPLNG